MDSNCGKSSYRSIGALLSSVFSSSSVHLDMYVVDNVKEVLDHCNSLESLLSRTQFRVVMLKHIHVGRRKLCAAASSLQLQFDRL